MRPLSMLLKSGRYALGHWIDGIDGLTTGPRVLYDDGEVENFSICQNEAHVEERRVSCTTIVEGYQAPGGYHCRTHISCRARDVAAGDSAVSIHRAGDVLMHHVW